MNNNHERKPQRGYYIFRAYYTRKDGVKVYARDFGHKAWRIWVTVER